MQKAARVTAYECRTKQAEIFRRAAAGETIIVTKNGAPHVEIRKAPTDKEMFTAAVHALGGLQQAQLVAGVGTSARELRRILEDGRGQ